MTLHTWHCITLHYIRSQKDCIALHCISYMYIYTFTEYFSERIPTFTRRLFPEKKSCTSLKTITRLWITVTFLGGGNVAYLLRKAALLWRISFLQNILSWEYSTGTSLHRLHISLWTIKASEGKIVLSPILPSAQHIAFSSINCCAA